MKINKKEQGLTLIALVVTIIILIILATVTISFLLGEGGLINKAISAKETMQISSGKEQIDLGIGDFVVEKAMKGEGCSLEYIKENLPSKITGLQIVGEKGSPLLEKIYVTLNWYEYEIDDKYNTRYVGNISLNQEPDLEVYQDDIRTGVEKVQITAKATVGEGSIEEVQKPSGKKVRGDETNYEVTENGEYTFTAYTERGRKVEKTIKIENIKGEGLDLTGLVTGSDTIEHSCIWENKYDDNYHWEQCSICGIVKNKIAHAKSYIGGNGTCNENDPERYEVCNNNCGYSKKITKQGHVSMGRYYGYDYYHYFGCKNCGGAFEYGSCTFRLSDGTIVQKGHPRIHEAGTNATCTVCAKTVNISKHEISYDSQCTCLWCSKSPTIIRKIGTEYNNMKAFEGDVTDIKMDLTSGKGSYIYMEVYCSLGSIVSANATDYTWGEITLSQPELYKTEANGNKVYKIKSSLNVVKMLNKKYLILSRAFCTYSDNPFGDSLGPIGTSSPIYVQYRLCDSNAPIISSITPTYINQVDGWARNLSINITGTARQKEMVTISIYDDKGVAIIENASVATTGGVTGNYSYTLTKPVESCQTKTFTVKVKDFYNNETVQTFNIQNIDSKAPTYLGETIFNKDWSKSKTITFEAEDRGIGEVQLGFNNKADYQLAEKQEEKYKRTYTFTGNIYESTNSIVYLKDSLGNEAIQKIQIGKIDNTGPNITKVDIAGGKVTIEANDRNETLGKEGSGIAGYAISNKREIPDTRSFQKSNSFEVKNPGTYYIYVIDNAGNLGQRQEVIIK